MGPLRRHTGLLTVLVLAASLLALPAAAGEPEDRPDPVTSSADEASTAAVCTGTNRTISGSVRGTNGRRVDVFVGLVLLNAAGQGINLAGQPLASGYADNRRLNAGISPQGEPADSGTPFTFTGIPNGACSFWLEVYPKLANGDTDRTYYGGGLVRNRPLTSSGSAQNSVFVPMTCGVGGGTPSSPTHTTTGDITVRAYVNGTPRAINRLSYFSIATPVNPAGRAYGFGVESPTPPRTPATASSVAADQSYNLRVQIPSTAGTSVAHVVPSVPVHRCRETFVHVSWTPFGVITEFGRFRDVSAGNPFNADITWMADQGISTGYSDGTYRPVAIVTRQAMSAFMYRLAGEPPFAAPGTPSFTDVTAANAFYAEIEWMADRVISTGYDDGTYRPSAQVTRGAMSAFMYRLAGEPDFIPPANPSFTDVAPDFAFFAEIEWMDAEEITTGYADGTYRAGAGVSRQAMSAFMNRLAPLLA